MGVLRKTIKNAIPNRVLCHLQALDHYLNGEPEIRLISQLASAGRDAVDAGANIGTYTYFLRKYAKNVFAFEPNPNLAGYLNQVFPDVIVRNLALSDRPGDVVLQIPVDPSGNFQHELASIAQRFDTPTKDYHVKSVTLDSENFADIGFLKVDVEQHEREVLRGALETIKRCRPTIMTEVCPLKYDAALPEVFGFITQQGYAGWFRFSNRWLPLTDFSMKIHSNREFHGDKKKFVGGNILFFPVEHSLSTTGPM
jgi:FkbM family methyltransferase